MAKTDWKDVEGTVTAVSEVPTRSGVSYAVSFNYKVDNHWYGGYYTTSDPYAVGDSITIRYDPKDPDRNDLSLRQTHAVWIIAAVVIAFVAFAVTVMVLSR